MQDFGFRSTQPELRPSEICRLIWQGVPRFQGNLLHSEDRTKPQDAMFQEILILTEYVSKNIAYVILTQELNTTEVCGCRNDWRVSAISRWTVYL